MRKLWWIAIGVFVMLAASLAIAVPVLLPSKPGVTYANYSRIEKGMTRDEISALLGKIDQDGSDSIWQSDKTGDMVIVMFDEEDRVNQSYWNGNFENRNTFRKLLDRLPWIGNPPPEPRSISMQRLIVGFDLLAV
jgi:outer membrane protein assembly factor BamE (lipoprotein component of BamABCDE complex)